MAGASGSPGVIEDGWPISLPPGRLETKSLLLSFSVLSSSVASEVRGRAMAFAYLSVNLGTALGPGLVSVITRIGLLAIFPTSAVLTGCRILVLILAQRQRS